MSQKDIDDGNSNDKSAGPPLIASERLVYVMPKESIRAFVDDDISLLEFWHILWRGKWLIGGITAIFSIVSIFYALTATEWFKAEVVLTPADSKSAPNLSGALGGLVSLAGVSVGGGDSVEALAVLRSREFTGSFIKTMNLMPLLVVQENDTARQDKKNSSGNDKPDIRDAIRYFNNNVRSVIEDRDTGLVTLAIEWKDPEKATLWANTMVERLNERMRSQALDEAQTNIDYLQDALGKTSVVTLQQSIGRLMENELQKLMLARGSIEFAFKVIDPAQVPKVRSRPRRTLTVILATLVGGMVGVLFVLVWHALSDVRRAAADQ